LKKLFALFILVISLASFGQFGTPELLPISGEDPDVAAGLLAVFGGDRGVELYDATTYLRYPVSLGYATAHRLSPDGGMIALTRFDGDTTWIDIQALDARYNKYARKLKLLGIHYQSQLAWASTTVIVFARYGKDNSLNIWKYDLLGKKLSQVTTFGQNAAAVDPEMGQGKTYFSGIGWSGNNPGWPSSSLWQLDTGDQIAGLSGLIRFSRLSPDGRYVASIQSFKGKTWRAIIFDFQTGKSYTCPIEDVQRICWDGMDIVVANYGDLWKMSFSP